MRALRGCGFFWRNLAEKKITFLAHLPLPKSNANFADEIVWTNYTQKTQSYSVLFSQKFEYEMTTAGIIQLPTCQGWHWPILKRSFDVLSFEFLTYFGFSDLRFRVWDELFSQTFTKMFFFFFQGQNKNFLSISILGHEKAKQSRPGGG